MGGVVKLGKFSAVCGLDWAAVTDINDVKAEVAERISRRAEIIDESGDAVPFTKLFATAKTDLGAYAAGIVLSDKTAKLSGKMVSLAALCAKFAQKQKDLVFVWQVEKKFFLIAIKNGLPIWDEVFETDKQLCDAYGFVVSIFENGCTVYGDTHILPPPVAEMGIEQLSEFIGKEDAIRSIGANAKVMAAIGIALLMAGGGWQWWEWQQAEELERQQQAAQAAVQQTEKQIFEAAQLPAISNIPGCANIKDVTSKILALNYDVRGYTVKSITGDCASGNILATYHSTYPSDLSAFKVDERLRISENLVDAALSIQAPPAVVESINVDSLKPRQEWLIESGAQKQRLEIVGISLVFGGASPVVQGVNAPADAKQVVKGSVQINGNAKYIAEASSVVANVIWQKIQITPGDNGIIFNLTGEYYAIKD